MRLSDQSRVELRGTDHVKGSQRRLWLYNSGPTIWVDQHPTGFMLRICCAGPPDSGIPLPLHGFAQNQIGCAIVALALDITAWMQTLALTSHDARRWEPKRLLHRLFTIPASIARTARRTFLHLSERAPWAAVAVHAITRLEHPKASPG